MPFSVDTQNVQSAGADIQRIAGEIESSVSQMTARLRGLQSTWTGAASHEFQATVIEWNSLQARVREDLAQIGRATIGAGDTYQRTEDQVTGLFRH